MERRYTVAILLSADTDRLGHVEVATWKGCSRPRFSGTQLPWCHTMSESQYLALQDTTNYAYPVD